MSLPTSGLIITYNEEANIGECLDSLSFLDQVFVVDSFSTDRTVEICREYQWAGVKVFQHAFENHSAQRNWALDNLPWSNDWVFVLDADEAVTPELRAEIRGLLASKPDCDGYLVKFRFVFLGKWLRHASTYPVWILRLFRRRKGCYCRSVNEYVELRGKIGRFQNDLIHHNRSGLAAWIAKHNDYSTREAVEYQKVLDGGFNERISEDGSDSGYLRRQRLKRLFIRLPFRPLLRFLYMYVWKRGFLDGKPGFIYCVLKAIQEFHISAKLYESRLAKGTKNLRN